MTAKVKNQTKAKTSNGEECKSSSLPARKYPSIPTTPRTVIVRSAVSLLIIVTHIDGVTKDIGGGLIENPWWERSMEIGIS
jgi:hypothetical protein